jgi:RimJ/RimL family protein N-acetyltransferase
MLRPVAEADLDVLFEQQRDPEANAMAAFGATDPNDRVAFQARWDRIRANPGNVARVILVDGAVAGTISRWRDEGLDAPEVTYWLGREFWGRGLATEALRAFLAELPDRRLYGRASATNPGSMRVLEKCGFTPLCVDRGVSASDGRTVDEVILRLDRP